jgi:hypothetical protein
MKGSCCCKVEVVARLEEGNKRGKREVGKEMAEVGKERAEVAKVREEEAKVVGGCSQCCRRVELGQSGIQHSAGIQDTGRCHPQVSNL